MARRYMTIAVPALVAFTGLAVMWSHAPAWWPVWAGLMGTVAAMTANGIDAVGRLARR